MKYQYNNGYPIQNIFSVRYGYFCLYFLDNIWRKSFYDCLKVFDLKDSGKNEKFIKSIFPNKNEKLLCKTKKTD